MKLTEIVVTRQKAIAGVLRSVFLGSAAALMIAASTVAGAAQSAPEQGSPPQTVSGPEISAMIRTTIVALHQANITGNYTVLRDLGASDLQATNTAAQLAELFRQFRELHLSLAPTVLFDAVLDSKPQLSTDGLLRLVGHFPTKPQEVIFDMSFHYERGDWRISGLKVGTRPAADGPPPKAKAPAAGANPKPPLPKVRPAPAPAK